MKSFILATLIGLGMTSMTLPASAQYSQYVHLGGSYFTYTPSSTPQPSWTTAIPAFPGTAAPWYPGTATQQTTPWSYPWVPAASQQIIQQPAPFYPQPYQQPFPSIFPTPGYGVGQQSFPWVSPQQFIQQFSPISSTPFYPSPSAAPQYPFSPSLFNQPYQQPYQQTPLVIDLPPIIDLSFMNQPSYPTYPISQPYQPYPDPFQQIPRIIDLPPIIDLSFFQQRNQNYSSPIYPNYSTGITNLGYNPSAYSPCANPTPSSNFPYSYYFPQNVAQTPTAPYYPL